MRKGKAGCKPVALCTVFLHFWPGKCVVGWWFITCPILSLGSAVLIQEFLLASMASVSIETCGENMPKIS